MVKMINVSKRERGKIKNWRERGGKQIRGLIGRKRKKKRHTRGN